MTSIADEGLDIDALKARYEAERDKRLREDGSDQYVEIEGEFARYLDDPYVDPASPRRRSTDETSRSLIVGGGFGGLLCRARGCARRASRTSASSRRAGDFGGTWYWNRYPGAACDIESYIYLPLLEEIGYIPTEKYARAPEILEHCQRDRPSTSTSTTNACFQTEVTELRWDEAAARWIVAHQPRRRDPGALRRHGQRPAAPAEAAGHPGHRELQGPHASTPAAGTTTTPAATADGGPDRPGGQAGRHHRHRRDRGAVRAAPRRVGASSSTSSSAPRPSIDVRDNRPTDPEWAKQPAARLAAPADGQLQHPRLRRVRTTRTSSTTAGPTSSASILLAAAPQLGRRLGRRRAPRRASMELADFQQDGAGARPGRRDRRGPGDRRGAEALVQRQFCKRPCFHDEYLDTFNRPNVHLVDTEGRGVERITEHGVVVDGHEYELDCLIYATGLRGRHAPTPAGRLRGHGRGGLTPDREVGGRAAHPARLHHAAASPTASSSASTQSGITANFPHMLDEQSKHIAYIIDEARRARAARWSEPTAEAEEAWVQTIVASARMRQTFQSSARPATTTTRASSPLAAANGAYGGARSRSSGCSTHGATTDNCKGSNWCRDRKRLAPLLRPVSPLAAFRLLALGQGQYVVAAPCEQRP